ncbi:MAG: protein phosphatase 2C domain-containing protein [Chloroflexota bacterium]
MNRTPRSDLIIGHQSHAGETGKNNEDRALNLSYQGLPGEKGGVTLAVVADGIGGHRAGEVASQIAIDTFTSLFDQSDSRSYLDLFARAFSTVSQTLAKHIANNPASEGMGTTCSVALIANRRLYTAFIGDSRIYLLRDGSIRQISVDHTWVQEAIEHGILNKQEARKHPNRHVVRRHLGAGQDPTPDYRMQLEDSESAETARRNQGMPLKPGDIVLLSSDGMTDLVEDHEILAAFQGKSPQEAVDSLVLLARQRGGYDNITITAVQVPTTDEPTVVGKRKRRGIAPALLGGTALAAILGIAGFVLLIALAVGVYFVFFNNPLQPTPTATVAVPTMTTAPILTPTGIPTTQQAILLPDTPTPITPTSTRTPPPTFTPTATPTIDTTAVWVPLTAQAQASTVPQSTQAPPPTSTPTITLPPDLNSALLTVTSEFATQAAMLTAQATLGP